MTDKKSPASPSANDFALHVLLVMKEDGLSKSKAQFRAWCEGPVGLNKRLGRPELPLQP